MVRTVRAHWVKYNLCLVCASCAAMTRELMAKLHMWVQMMRYELLLVVMNLRTQTGASHIIHGRHYIRIVLFVPNEKALVLIPIS